MGRNLKVTIDKALCVSNQACVQSAAGTFGLDADGKAELIDVNGNSEEEIVDAAFNCPVSAIGVFDADTGEDLLD
jgi:ferredoxin